MAAEREIYVVTSGEYSDYHIVAVFDDEAIAEKFVAVRKAAKSWFDDMRIEAYALNDTWTVQEIERGVTWNCREPDGENARVVCSIAWASAPNQDEWTARYIKTKFKAGWEVTVNARDEQSAVKIAAEKIAQAKAEREGIA